MKKVKWTLLVGILLSVGIVTALWLLGPAINGYATYKVKSDKTNITIMENLIGADLDTTNSSVNFTDNIWIKSNVKQNYLVDLNLLKQDNETDSCTDYLNDCTIEFYFDDEGYGYDTPILDGDTVELRKGDNYINVKGNCKQYSCPQNIVLNMTLSPIE